jgi:hypothetical protein
MAERYERPVVFSSYEVSKRLALRSPGEPDQDVRKESSQVRNAEYTKANSDAGEVPIAER